MRHVSIQVNKTDEKFKTSLKSRIIIAFVLFAILIPAIFLGGYVFLAVLVPFIAIGIFEILKAPGKKYHWWVHLFTYFIVYLYAYWFIAGPNLSAYLNDPTNYVFSLTDYYDGLSFPLSGILLSLIIYFLIGILDETFSFHDVAYFFLMTLLVGFGFQSFFFLRYVPFYFAANPNLALDWPSGLTSSLDTLKLGEHAHFQYLVSAELILFGFIGAAINDTLAYFMGTYFGRHKINPRVSPNKTWEGFLFGLLGTFVILSAVGFTLASFGFAPLPFLTLDNWYWILLFALAVPLFGDLGDLAFSFVKRSFVIKDFGKILKGHGGVLDRVDSHMFTALGLSILVVVIIQIIGLF